MPSAEWVWAKPNKPYAGHEVASIGRACQTPI